MHPLVSWQERYLHRFYNREHGWIDGTEEFHRLLGNTIPRCGVILEIGSGPSNKSSRFLATLGELHGIDLDPEVRENDALNTAEVLSRPDSPYPYADASFDACVSDYVAEHIARPDVHLSEVARVLRPGGAYIFRTPNSLHYVSLVARLTPQWFHDLVANRLRPVEHEADRHPPYPTVHAMNTSTSIQRLSRKAGLLVDSIQMVEKEPSYGLRSRGLFFPFLAYERLVNSTDRAAFLRANLFVVLRKPRGADMSSL